MNEMPGPTTTRVRFGIIKLLLFFVVSVICRKKPVDFKSMRSRELRKHLLSLGHDRDELSKIMDRQELKLLAEEFYRKKQKYDDDAAYKEKGVKFSIACIIIASILFFWEKITAFLSSFRPLFDGYVYQIQERLRLVSVSLTSRLHIAAISFILAAALEFILPILQLSVLAGWVIPSGSPFRRFLISMPSMPITLNHFLGTKKRSSSSSDASARIGDIGDIGINVAPMILMWVLNYVKQKLEEIGASRLIKVVDEKQRKREDRDAVRNFRSKMAAESEFIVMDFAEDDVSATHAFNSIGGPAAPVREARHFKGPSPFEEERNLLNSTFVQKCMRAEAMSNSADNIDMYGLDENSIPADDDEQFWLSDSG